MKSEHRHELKTNDLNRLVTEWSHFLERYFLEHTGQIAVVTVLLLAAVLGFYFWRSAEATVDSEGWRALANATSDADLANVADKYAGTTVAAWARLREAERQLSNGIRLSFTSREAGNSDLKKAQENFEKLIDEKTIPRDILERALFGLATAREAMPPKGAKPSDIDDAAIKSYQRLLEAVPETVYKQLAEARIAALRTGTAQDFYAWFERQNPKPADREMPKDLTIPPLPDMPIPGSSLPAPTPPGTVAPSKTTDEKATTTAPAGPKQPGEAAGGESPGAKSPSTKSPEKPSEKSK